MTKPHYLPPSAACLAASLRDLGYSLETAIADLIDNSISADATDIQILCDMSRSDPVLVISDNGHGMSESEVISAMRHGSTDPRKQRGANDLGRFGLGLKTASFSQCRKLTVVSSKNQTRSAVEWSLSQIVDNDDWYVGILDDKEIAALPFVELLPTTGTIVLWRELDRLFEEEFGDKRDEIVNEKLAAVERHLSLVFHRFLTGEVKGRKRITIKLNGHTIAAFDPFCRKNPATQMLPEETVWIGDYAVQMQPYILPHHSRLTADQYDFYQDRSDFISNQGAFVYRNGRLMAWGDWFRLIPKGEATKLARVQIDFPNSLDEAWTIDIKKSRARPPHAVRERLRQIISKITARSIIVHRGRGQKLFQESQSPMWERYADHGGIRFVVNIEHPLIQSLVTKLAPGDVCNLYMLLDSIAASLPVEMIYSDYSTNPRDVSQPNIDESEILERLKGLRTVLYGDESGDPLAFMQIVRSTRLFEKHLDTVEKYIRGAFV
ncbi:MAG: ATP-binding protein [Methylophilaceae bacterium]